LVFQPNTPPFHISTIPIFLGAAMNIEILADAGAVDGYISNRLKPTSE
jgi:hypothetical protein